MRKQVIFIHGAGKGAYHEDEKLAANLQHLLGAAYEVHYPVMQNEADPNYEAWARQINENILSSQGAVILVGHSLGASILMKFLTENEIDKPVAGVFLIATPYWGGDKGWKYEGYETLVLPTKSDTKLTEEVPLFLYHSRDDEGVPFAHLALYANRFPGATVRELDGRGHQLNNNLSEVADDIKATLK